MIKNKSFSISVEVVPPQGSDMSSLLTALSTLKDLSFDRFSVASNPVAKPGLSALTVCMLIQRQLTKKCALHCTTRDHNRLSLQSLLWGAKALDLHSVLVMTGDYIALEERTHTTMVRDLDVFDLIQMARASDLKTGVVFDTGGESKGIDFAVRRLERKVAVGAQYVVTQPVYDPGKVESLMQNLAHINIPIIIGVLPLYSFRHASFLHQQVSGIEVPEAILNRMASAKNQFQDGISIARDIIVTCREKCDGVCLMPAFNHYEVLQKLMF